MKRYYSCDSILGLFLLFFNFTSISRQNYVVYTCLINCWTECNNLINTAIFIVCTQLLISKSLNNKHNQMVCNFFIQFIIKSIVGHQNNPWAFATSWLSTFLSQAFWNERQRAFNKRLFPLSFLLLSRKMRFAKGSKGNFCR